MRGRGLATTWMLVLGMAVTAAPAFAQSETPESQYDSAGGGSAAPNSGGTAQASQSETDPAASGGAEYGSSSGSSTSTPKYPVVDGFTAKMLPNGKAAAPSMAPARVQKAIWAANEIVGKPYIYGGGHARWKDKGYDCSSTISYALWGGRMLKAPLNSSGFMSWGAKGRGAWITIYTNPGHAYVVIAGLRLDTSAAGDPSGKKGPRWRPNLRETSGYVVRHPAGF